VFQWNEANYDGSSRGLESGSIFHSGYALQAGNRSSYDPSGELNTVGFRVVQEVPEPASLGILTIGVIGMLVRRRGTRR
jgi:hypothetical protein